MTPAATNTMSVAARERRAAAAVVGTDSAIASDTAPRKPATALTTRAR